MKVKDLLEILKYLDEEKEIKLSDRNSGTEYDISFVQKGMDGDWYTID